MCTFVVSATSFLVKPCARTGLHIHTGEEVGIKLVRILQPVYHLPNHWPDQTCFVAGVDQDQAPSAFV